MRLAAAALFVIGCTQAPAPGPIAGNVTVRVFTNLSNTPPIAGAKVAFVDPDGTGTIVTADAKGVARGTLTAGGSVTALVPTVPQPNPPILSTVLDVQPGDDIALGFAPYDGGPAPTGTPTCAQDTIVATYTGGDALSLAGIDLQRDSGTDVKDGTAATPIGKRATIQITGAPAVSATMHTDLQGPAAGDQQWIGETIDGCATTYALDLSQGLLPWVGVPTMSADATTLHVPLTGGHGGDLLYAMIAWTHQGAEVQWTIAGPVGADTTLPVLPGELAQYQPAPADTFAGLSAWVLDYGKGGYDGARADAMGIGLAGDGMMIPSTGRVRGSYRIQ